jgi:hypothetical protein
MHGTNTVKRRRKRRIRVDKRFTGAKMENRVPVNPARFRRNLSAKDDARSRLHPQRPNFRKSGLPFRRFGHGHVIVDYHGVPVTRQPLQRLLRARPVRRTAERSLPEMRRAGGLEPREDSSRISIAATWAFWISPSPSFSTAYTRARSSRAGRARERRGNRRTRKIVESCKYPLASDFLRDLDERKNCFPLWRVTECRSSRTCFSNQQLHRRGSDAENALNESLDDAEKIGKNAGERGKGRAQQSHRQAASSI